MADIRLTKRKEKSQQIRETILDVSRRLFIQYGYSATTIRQILQEAGITTGTLYHFFQDKEDILLQIADDHMNDASRLVNSLLPDNRDPSLFYAMEMSLMFTAIEKYEMIAELYLSMYQSWRVIDMICHNHGKINMELFGKSVKGMSDEWWYAHSLAISGIIQNCIAEHLNNKKLGIRMHLQIILATSFGYFNIPLNKIDPAISRAMDIIHKKKPGLYGIYL